MEPCRARGALPTACCGTVPCDLTKNKEMAMLRRIISVAVAAAVTVCLCACSPELDSTEEESRTVMTVDKWEVPYEMYRYAVMMTLRDRTDVISANAEDEAVSSVTAEGSDKSSAEAEPAETEDATARISAVVEGLSDKEKAELSDYVNEHSIETIVNIYSLFTAAEEAGIDPFGEMIDSLTDMKMEELRATYKNDREYLETIKLFFMNNSVYSILTRYELVFDQLYELYVKNGEIDTSDEAVISYMNGDDAVRVKQILISFERHSESEALELIEQVSKELSEHTGDDGHIDAEQFDRLTDSYGEDLYMFKNRDGYYISRGYSDKSFETAAFELEIGEMSDIVRTSAGYSILLREEKELSYIEDNVSKLKDTCLGGIYRSMLDEYSANADVKLGEEAEELDVFSMK